MTAAAAALDYAGVAALLTVVGSGLWKLAESWRTRADRRQEALDAREAMEAAKNLKTVEQQAIKIGEMDRRLQQMERGYHALAGVTHVLVDELQALSPQSSSFVLIARSLRLNFPIAADMPAELQQLLARIEKGPSQGAPA